MHICITNVTRVLEAMNVGCLKGLKELEDIEGSMGTEGIEGSMGCRDSKGIEASMVSKGQQALKAQGSMGWGFKGHRGH